MLTTVTAIGYGDLTPVSRTEMIIGCFLNFVGQFYVIYVLTTFRSILDDFETISAFNMKRKSMEADEIALQSWLVLLTRYRDNKPFPISLETQISEHFRYFWL
jgi:hypothetical protein